jgi:hypothetical protein
VADSRAQSLSQLEVLAVDCQAIATAPRAHLFAVVIREDVSVAAVAEERAAPFTDVSRCLHPARGFRIELPELLQRSVFLRRQEFNPHPRRKIERAVGRFVFLPRLERLAVVTRTSTTFRALRRTVAEEILASLPVVTDDIRLAAGLFPFDP